ncbi:endonuclease exonuclease phosphatase domain containing protein [Plakobranchus ocellatus]|uniref:Endonuclease exonuclease phosphatase domain containing protein n=1 Tax=Plakobranchus ocellatus TaxID=259542 RepID=A0AAV4A8G2_9GAST|nr:endonuclease exonuclease phosphatase domain containing protein [Plakobranchus ocellatus]
MTLHSQIQLDALGSTKERDKSEYIATYNTRTIRQQDDLERLLEELEQIKWHIIGLSETKRGGEGLSELPGGHWIFEKGKTDDNPTAKGVALLMNRNMTKHVEKTNIYSERIILCTIKNKRRSTKYHSGLRTNNNI